MRGQAKSLYDTLRKSIETAKASGKDQELEFVGVDEAAMTEAKDAIWADATLRDGVKRIGRHGKNVFSIQLYVNRHVVSREPKRRR